MKNVKNINKKINEEINFTKKANKGISLIVLVITIILIVILASSIILSISSNNPVKEANLARYESDTANMQAIFTNSVAKVMAQNQSTVSIKAGKINMDTSGVSEARGEIEYILEYAMNKDNTYGKIIFDVGTNKEKEYYTGKKLPIYAAGETKWYVDEEGNISLKVKDIEYGNGVIPPDPGIYDDNGTMIASWDELVNDYGINVQTDYVTIDEIEEYLYSETLPEVIQTGNYPAAKLFTNSKFANTTKLVIGNDVTKIGSGAFVFFINLEEIVIPSGVTSIGDATFALCSKLKNIQIPKTLTSIGYLAFGKCYDLEYINLPSSLKEIGEEAFWGCTGLKSIEIPNLVENVSREAFCECTSLKKVKIGDSVENIADSAFSRCSNLEEIEIGKNVKNIYSYAFNDCDSLSSITIPSSVNEIDSDSFNGCDNLTKIYYKGPATGKPWGAENATVITDY